TFAWTPRKKSNTTATAAFCRMFCGNWPLDSQRIIGLSVIIAVSGVGRLWLRPARPLPHGAFLRAPARDLHHGRLGSQTARLSLRRRTGSCPRPGDLPQPGRCAAILWSGAACYPET